MWTFRTPIFGVDDRFIVRDISDSFLTIVIVGKKQEMASKVPCRG